jgi:hypothetical protein
MPADAGVQARFLRQLASAALHAELGDVGAALEELPGLVEAMLGTGVTLLLPEAAARLVAIEAVVDPAAARDHFDLFDWALGGEGGARENFLRLLARAAIRRAEGRYEGAATAAADAAGMTESRGLPFLAAQAHLAGARALAQAGHSGKARLAVAAAARCYRAAGAAATARRVESEWPDTQPTDPPAFRGAVTLPAARPAPVRLPQRGDHPRAAAFGGWHGTP